MKQSKAMLTILGFNHVDSTKSLAPPTSEALVTKHKAQIARARLHDPAEVRGVPYYYVL